MQSNLQNKMTSRSPIQLKFSNLLQANPQGCFYAFDLNADNNTQNSNVLFEKIRRKSLNLGMLRPKRPIQSSNQDQQKTNIKQYINKSKINRLLLEADFEKECEQNRNKKKKLYIIRKRQQKNKKQLRYQRSPKTSDKKDRNKDNQQINQVTQPAQSPKKKKKSHIFGLEDLTPKILAKKKFSTPRNPSLLNCTSSNCFYNTTFFINSKIRQFQQARQQNRIQANNIGPAIRSILPHPLNNEPLIERKKQIQKFYTTNTSNFSFIRSKTEQIDTNYLCGWQRQELEYYENQDII